MCELCGNDATTTIMYSNGDNSIHKCPFCSIACAEVHMMLCRLHSNTSSYMEEVEEFQSVVNKNGIAVPELFTKSVLSSYRDKIQQNCMLKLAEIYCARHVDAQGTQGEWMVWSMKFEDESQILYIVSCDGKMILATIRAKYICSIALNTNLVTWSNDLKHVVYPPLINSSKKEMKLMKSLLKENLVLRDFAQFMVLPGLYCHITGCEKVISTGATFQPALAFYGFNTKDIHYFPCPVSCDEVPYPFLIDDGTNEIIKHPERCVTNTIVIDTDF